MWPRFLYQVKNVFSSSDPVDHLLATKKYSIERLFQCAKCAERVNNQATK